MPCKSLALGAAHLGCLLTNNRSTEEFPALGGFAISLDCHCDTEDQQWYPLFLTSSWSAHSSHDNTFRYLCDPISKIAHCLSDLFLVCAGWHLYDRELKSPDAHCSVQLKHARPLSSVAYTVHFLTPSRAAKFGDKTHTVEVDGQADAAE